ncbi:MAG: MBL fold metallo-hydrolase [Deltaproteobacteria bacterium]|nr:MBL fold metallo-hydrolase [Deltaproteobacteria bacterium]
MDGVEILKDLFFIERGFLNGNHFVYRSRDPVLIDTGYIAGFDETARRINAVGVDLSRVGLIVSTHCHCDHIGGNRIIQERSGCAVALHGIGRHFIETRDDWSTWWRYYHQEADFFTCTRSLEDGEILPIGPHRFQVLHTPGHASDGIVLYNREDRLLISSDTLWEKDMAVITVRVEGSTAVQALAASLERLSGLDVERVYPGHGRPFTDFRRAVSRSMKRLRAYLSGRERIGMDLLKKIIIYTLLMKKAVPAESLFPWLMGTRWFRETVDLYFDGAYRSTYDGIMRDFLRRDVVRREGGVLHTTVRP